jgi:transcriptional regulator with XRE-family HTH domain
MLTGPAATPQWAEFMRGLGINLRRARDTRRLTQEKVAEYAGISLYAYQKYERGASLKDGPATNPYLSTVIVLSEVLDMPLSELLPPLPKLTAK